MIKPDGDKITVNTIMTREQIEFIERRSAQLGLNKSAFMRLLIAQEMEREGKNK